MDLQEESENHSGLITSLTNLFTKITTELYDLPASFVVEPTTNGYNFILEVHGEDSKGVNNMIIFSFDIMLMHIWKNTIPRPDFLVHDSHLFDGVDFRQRYHALRIAKEKSIEENYQYIIIMNKDEFPYHVDGISDDQINDILSHQNKVSITDSDNGGLFGILFD